MKRPPGGEPDRGSPAPRGEPSLVDFVGAMQVRSLAVYGLLLLAAIYFLHFTATVMIPLAMAVLFKILLSPVSGACRPWACRPRSGQACW